MCPLCHFSLETEEHVFLDFQDTRRVWFSPPLEFHIPKKIYIHVWMLKWFQCRDQSWAQLVCATLWRIWHGRNQQMFQQKEFKLMEIARGMSRLVEEVSWDKIIYQGGCETSGEAVNGTIIKAECCAFIDVIFFPGAWITLGCIKKYREGNTSSKLPRNNKYFCLYIWLRRYGCDGAWRWKRTWIGATSQLE